MAIGSSITTEIYDAYRNHGLRYVATRSVEEISLKTPLGKRLYWRIAPALYAKSYRRELRQGIDFQPLRLIYVDPASITDFTGRERPLGSKQRNLIGTCMEGDWDLDTERAFECDVVYNSLKDRIVHGCSWIDTPLYDKAIDGINEGNYWHGCKTEEQVMERFNSIDRLVHQIKSNGYQSQFELIEDGKINRDYIGCFLHEVNVDIGRDGQILFVDGRHRLSIAKLLGLDHIPAFPIVRHEKWITNILPPTAPQHRDHPELNAKILPQLRE